MSVVATERRTTSAWRSGSPRSRGAPGPEVVAVPSGLLARGAFRWRDGDVLLAVSSSGEFRDLVEATEGRPPVPSVAITSTPGSTIASRVGARALVTVLEQRAVTHTQAFCGNVAAALAVWAEVTADAGLADALRRLPEDVEAALAASRSLGRRAGGRSTPANAIAFGSGAGWAAALEAALLLKEVAGVPTEGVETREGATSAMMALRPGDLVLSLPTEARRRAARRGGGDLRRAGRARAPCAARRRHRLPARRRDDVPGRRRAQRRDRPRPRPRRRPARLDGRLLPRRARARHEPGSRRARLRQRLRGAVSLA